MTFTVCRTARVAHEVNRVYCESLGDGSQPTWDDAPSWQRQSAVLGVWLYSDHPEAGPEVGHEVWKAEKIADGWVYGPEKDPAAKTHPNLVTFKELPKEQQVKGVLFRAVVHALMLGD